METRVQSKNTRVPITHQECIGLNELPKRVPLLSPGIFEAPSLAPSFRGDFKFARCPTHLLSPGYHLLYYLWLTFSSHAGITSQESPKRAPLPSPSTFQAAAFLVV